MTGPADQEGPELEAFRADLLHQDDARLNRKRRARIAAVLGAFALVFAGIGGAAWWLLSDLPSLPPNVELSGWRRAPGMTFVDRDGRMIATRGPRYGRPIALAELPPYAPLAFMAAEDRRFRQHSGVDPRGVARAMWRNFRAGRTVEGGSTLTQQLAREMLLSSDRTLKRKLQEMILAWRLENRLTKDEVLALYLNRVFLGENAYGIEAASMTYFGKSAARLTLAEAAVLAGLPRAPGALAPTRNRPGALRRAALVLGQMREEGWITEADRAKALAEHLSLVQPIDEGDFAWALDVAAAEAVSRARSDAGDLVVVLTLDPAMQRAAATAVRRTLDESGRRRGAPQAALVALGPDGSIRALIGGYDHAMSPFNRATQARRQPGSAFKPLVWAAALETGIPASATRPSTAVTVAGWRPADGSEGAGGEMDLTTALAVSSNSVAVRLAQEIGTDRVVRTARRFGIEGLPPDPGLSLALGAYEVTLLDLTGAYRVFQDQGRWVRPWLVEAVARSDGRVLYQHPAPEPEQVFDPPRAGAMVRMMSQVISRGTGKDAGFGRPAAGKTGTSQNYRDAWFVGFTPDWTAGVWVGADDGRAMDRVTGGELPAEIWRRFMEVAHADLPPRPFPSDEAWARDTGAELVP